LEFTQGFGIFPASKITLLLQTEKSDFYGKGTPFLCLLRNFSARNGRERMV